MSGAACSFWQKVLMAALSKVLVQVTEQSILRWMREREWRRERQREGERETETGKSSAPSGTGCTFVTLVLWSQISKSSTHALPSALRDVGHVTVLAWIQGAAVLDKNRNSGTFAFFVGNTNQLCISCFVIVECVGPGVYHGGVRPHSVQCLLVEDQRRC